MSLKDTFQPSRSSVFLPTSRTRPALRCPACRSAPPVWRAASRRLTRSSCSGRAAVARICDSLVTPLSIEVDDRRSEKCPTKNYGHAHSLRLAGMSGLFDFKGLFASSLPIQPGQGLADATLQTIGGRPQRHLAMRARP